MIIFKKWGWLGNQIFQYCAIRSMMKPSEKLILWGFEQFEELFDNTDAVFVNERSSRLKKAFFKRFFNIAEYLAKKKWVSFITEYNDQKLVIEQGKLNCLTLVHGAFFQYETILNSSVVDSLKIKQIYQDKADKVLNSLQIQDKVLFFVHVRRGDYLKWPDLDHPAVLPLEYYQNCIKRIRKKYKNPYFIITSDDKNYIKDHFKDENYTYVSLNDYKTDFALMAKCFGGILSASSFSWWAAYYVHQKNKHALLLAPEYWVGHRKKRWYPLYIKTSFMDYVNVEYS